MMLLLNNQFLYRNSKGAPMESVETESTSPAPSPASNQLLKNPNMAKTKKKSPLPLVVASFVVVLLGLGTGYLIHSMTRSSSPAAPVTTSGTSGQPLQITAGETYGANNGEVFSDEVEGVLVAGGLSGEGTHHLLRPGGPSQNVYLTSSVVDLDLFVDHHVKIWGETFAAQEAGWLMDVGKVEVIELNAEKPFEENVN